MSIMRKILQEHIKKPNTAFSSERVFKRQNWNETGREGGQKWNLKCLLVSLSQFLFWPQHWHNVIVNYGKQQEMCQWQKFSQEKWQPEVYCPLCITDVRSYIMTLTVCFLSAILLFFVFCFAKNSTCVIGGQYLLYKNVTGKESVTSRLRQRHWHEQPEHVLSRWNPL